MKLTVQVKLLPTPEQATALKETLRACNTAALHVAATARQVGCYRNYDLRRHTYHGIKADYRLGAQAAQHVIKKVADAYSTLAANLKSGSYGKPGSKRRRRIETNPITFRWDAAQPYDARMLSWSHDSGTVSIWTVHGRIKAIPFTGSPAQLKAVATSPVGECDLVHRDGMWFLYALIEVGEPQVYEPDGFLGVDLGIANIAFDCDGTRYAGTALNGYRRRQLRLRRRLQQKGTKSAKRLLVRRRKKETRHAANVQPRHRQEHRDRGCTHRPRDRR